MRAIKIDALNRTVTEVEIAATLKDIKHHVECEVFTIGGGYENGDAVYCDDNGLLSNPQNFFTLGATGQPVAGNGLIVGTDLEGRTVACKTLLADVKNDVIFADLQNVLKSFT